MENKKIVIGIIILILIIIISILSIIMIKPNSKQRKMLLFVNAISVINSLKKIFLRL